MKKVGFSTVDEILDDILKTCPFALQDAAKHITADEFHISQHFNLGMTIRNKYFLSESQSRTTCQKFRQQKRTQVS